MVASRLEMAIILKAPFILTMDSRRPILRDGAVAIKAGTITGLGHHEAVAASCKGARKIELQNAVLLPGLVNVHTHIELPHLLSIIRASSFSEWLINLIKAKKALRTDDYMDAARRNVRTMLLTGTTTVGEICTHDISPDVLRQSGMRAVVFHEIIDMGQKRRGRGQGARVRGQGAGGLIKHGLSPHSPYTVCKSVLLEINRTARSKKIPVAMHVAESRDEKRLLTGRRSGLRSLYELAGWDPLLAPVADSPVRYLDGLGMLGPHFLAVHAVVIDEGDIAVLRRRRVSIAHCPRSNTETKVGRMPIKQLIEAGINIGLGTDSLASSPSLSMWDEMRHALGIHRRDGITSEDMLRMATISGAMALGLEKVTGSISIGKRADIIAVPMPRKNTSNLYNDLLRETEYCIMSMIDGKMVLKPSATGTLGILIH